VGVAVDVESLDILDTNTQLSNMLELIDDDIVIVSAHLPDKPIVDTSIRQDSSYSDYDIIILD
jgi:hypothetical protein